MIDLEDIIGEGEHETIELLGAPYPIVLCHGFFGFDSFAGADFLTYYFQIVDDLAAHGEIHVFTPTVDPFNDSMTRGAQLIEHVEAILAQTGHARVNLVGHSQGGLDARVVAHFRPDLVASVTTIATPHYGTPLSDIVLGLVQNDGLRGLLDVLAQIIGSPLYDEIGNETSVFAALEQFSQPGIEAFNQMITDADQVDYYSITGVTDFHPGGLDCVADDPPDFIAATQGTLDPVDPLFILPESIVGGGLLSIPNDGLVRVQDAKWGRFLGCIYGDHMDEVGQLLGDHPGLLNTFEHKAFYRGLVEWLRLEGY